MPKINKLKRYAYFKSHSIRSGINDGVNFLSDREGWNGNVMYYSIDRNAMRLFNQDGKNHNLKLKIRRYEKRF